MFTILLFIISSHSKFSYNSVVWIVHRPRVGFAFVPNGQLSVHVLEIKSKYYPVGQFVTQFWSWVNKGSGQ